MLGNVFSGRRRRSAIWLSARIGKMLERADVPLRTVEFFWIEIGAVVAVSCSAALFGGSLPVMLAADGRRGVDPVLVWSG